MKTPKVSICIPFHWMENWPVLLSRCLMSIEAQSFKDYEVILVKSGSMPATTNQSMQSAKGELIKVLFMDDYFATANSLKEIVDNFKGNWLITGCIHDLNGEVGNYHEPKYTEKIYTGDNGIGSPSVLTMSREKLLTFDESLSWLLDCDLYKRLYDSYGPPTLLSTPNVIIGLHDGQTSVLMSDKEKQKELDYMNKKYA